MVKSLNSKVDLVVNGTNYSYFTEYGKIMIGNAGFEFYSNRDRNKYIQIPWDIIQNVTAVVHFKGKWIPKFSIQVNNNKYYFSSKEPKKTLKAMQNYIGKEKMFQSLSIFKIIKNKFTKNKK